jgi:dihydrofolate synthase/folylpolyglutamate synthase
LPLPRAASAAQLEQILLDAGVTPKVEPDAETTIQSFSSPADAFANAMSRAGENDRIAVFGSFLTVAGVMAARNAGYH